MNRPTLKKTLCAFALLVTAIPSFAEFVTGQLLTATQLNSAFANVLPIAGGTLTGPLAVPSLTAASATLNNVTTTGAFASPAFASFGNQSTWLRSLISCSTDCAQTWSQSTGGGSGLLGATRSSDNTLAGSMAAQGIAGYAINDNTAQVQTVYGGYLEARRAASAGTTQGSEIDIVNQGSVVGLDPYNMFSTGTTPALWLSSGRPDVTTSAANASAAIGIINNNTAFENGIVFHSSALNTTTGEGNAIVLPQKDAVVWFGSSGNKVAAIRSDATTAALRMIFANGQMVLQDLSGNTKFTFTSTGGFTTPSSIQGATVYGTNGVVLPVTTVAGLPGCGAGTRGYMYVVTDASSPTYNGAVTGGGTTTVPVLCNATSWTAH